ncbi:substrate-binding periplasmic protein [Glaciecola sp. MF2-115]|uniref:substrate-binding periplasmic protein n=1 Tax=Glaciecola sp. MF2-115 TaxID=3384827 RepID=UPI00399FB5DE
MKKYVFGAILFLFLNSINSAISRPLDDIQKQGTIIVAVYGEYPPFSYLNENDEPSGIDVDIAKHIAKKLGVDIDFIWMTAGETSDDDLRNYIWKGHIIHKVKADLMMRAPYDRKYSMKRDDVGLLVNELVHMFGPYHSETWKIVHNVERLPDVPTMSMFQYHKIGVENDSIPYFYLNSAFKGIFRNNTSTYSNNEEAISAMQAGKVDAVMGLRSQISHLHADLPKDEYKLSSNAFPLIGKQKWDIGMAVHNDYRALAYETGDVVTELIMSGEMQKIFDKYNTIYQMPDYYKTE